jgi:predicted RNA-binding protein with PUA-like domain
MPTWIAKSEPGTYSWTRLTTEKHAVWDGVRNYEARNNLAAMKRGDRVLFYHSGVGREVVGIAEVVREAYPDATSDDPRWVAVDLAPVRALARPVTLAQFKADALLKETKLVKQGRISVSPVTQAQFDRVLELGGG